MIGIDIIPAQPPKGVSTIQGNFLSEAVQNEVKSFLRRLAQDLTQEHRIPVLKIENRNMAVAGDLAGSISTYFPQGMSHPPRGQEEVGPDDLDIPERGGLDESVQVDVVLSDMSAPWEQTAGFWKQSLSDPYHRMMNTSGNNFRDHSGSMVCIQSQSLINL